MVSEAWTPAPSMWASMWKRRHPCENVDATLTVVTRPFALIAPFALGRSPLMCKVTARTRIPCNVTLDNTESRGLFSAPRSQDARLVSELLGRWPAEPEGATRAAPSLSRGRARPQGPRLVERVAGDLAVTPATETSRVGQGSGLEGNRECHRRPSEASCEA